MNEWDALTDRGKARRLRPLVEDVLLAYGLQGARVRLIEVATNIVFRIDSPDTGPSFALKVDVEDDFPDSHRDIALGWLAAINADADIPVVELIKSVDGSNYVRADAPGVPPGRTCTMYNWVKGRTLFDDPTPLAYRQLGELTAQLHEHSSGYQPVGDPLRWDRVFYFPNEKYVVDDPAYGSKITDRQRDLVLECTEAVSPILAALYDHPGRLIHADLHGWNVNVYRGHLTLLDFDDVLWGQPVQDIAITFGYHRGHADYPAWLESYEEGYRAFAEWPATDWAVVDALMIARRLMFTNYVMKLPGDWTENLAEWEKMFEAYLK